MSTKLIITGKEVAKSNFPKTDARYWEGAIFKPRFSPKGVPPDRSKESAQEDPAEGGRKATLEVKHFSMRIHFQGERLTIPLNLANKAAAARRARDIYLSLMTHGKQKTLASYHPKHLNREEQVPGRAENDGVGEYVALATALAGVAPRTIAGYVTSLRMIAAGVAGIRAGKSKYDHRTGGRQKWLDNVDAVPLADLTAAAVEEWKLRFVSKRKGNPVEERKARNSANSFIRQARSLFAPRIVKLVSGRIRLPEPLPFKDVTLFPRSSMRYDSRINIHELVKAANNELGLPKLPDETPKAFQTRIEQFKIFLLAAFCGLRRNEIDKLLWDQVDLKAGTVEVRETAHFKPKSEESHGLIKIEPEVVALLAGFKKSTSCRFVIDGPTDSKQQKTPQWYRAKCHLDGLMEWLKKHGVDDLKPLHVLRKEAGSLICGAMGLYAASRFLRHGDVRVTAEHYLDKKSQVTVGMGSLLRQSPGDAAPAEAKRRNSNKETPRAREEGRLGKT